jgi:ribosomal 50S subunit-associated protein YjgA (DUF615 family)
MKTLEQRKMSAQLIKKTVKGRDFGAIDWEKEFDRFKDRFKDTPNRFFTITLTENEQLEVEDKNPPYEVPKHYPDDERQLVREAMAEAEKEKHEGFDRGKSFDNLFQIQEKINKHVKNP